MPKGKTVRWKRSEVAEEVRRLWLGEMTTPEIANKLSIKRHHVAELIKNLEAASKSKGG